MTHFQTDWNDGLAASALVKSKGGAIPGGARNFDTQPQNWIENLDKALRKVKHQKLKR